MPLLRRRPWLTWTRKRLLATVLGFAALQVVVRLVLEGLSSPQGVIVLVRVAFFALDLAMLYLVFSWSKQRDQTTEPLKTQSEELQERQQRPGE